MLLNYYYDRPDKFMWSSIINICLEVFIGDIKLAILCSQYTCQYLYFLYLKSIINQFTHIYENSNDYDKFILAIII